MAFDDRILDQAAAWAARAADPSFEDWEGFTAWLEADPAHSEAYDLVTAAVADAADALQTAPTLAADVAQTPANDDDGPRVLRRRWIGGALAASLAALGAVGLWQAQNGTYVVETAPGETRMIALEDGTSVMLAGGSRIELDHGDARFAELEAGQALFTVRHDEANPFRVDVGEDEFVDLGTVFDVKLNGSVTTVAVSEGAVAFNPRKQNVRIDPGHVLTADAASARYTLGTIATAQVGEWRDGRLTFQNETLGAVAQDLGRATGLAITAAPGAAQRRVSGSLLIEPVRNDPASLGPLLGVGVSKADEGWVIGAR
ncbi:FecR family protein [Altererythrobacter fulvus]|uniref:FecR family protein n=1 Tax=Caenibius fulvus TaxID=2126012 RepID=UPI0030184A8A